MVLLAQCLVCGFWREHVELGDEFEDFLHVHFERPYLRCNRRFRLLKAPRLLYVVQITGTLLHELIDVLDFGQNLPFLALFNEALQIHVNSLDIVPALVIVF